MLTRTGRALQTRTMRTEYDIVLFIIQYLVGHVNRLGGFPRKSFCAARPAGAPPPERKAPRARLTGARGAFAFSCFPFGKSEKRNYLKISSPLLSITFLYQNALFLGVRTSVS